jgi:type IV pilus assembly protein PilB
VSRAQQRNLGELLLEAGVISEAELEEALKRQRSTGQRIGAILRELGICTSEDVEWALSAQYSLPFRKLEPGHTDPEGARLVPAEIARTELLVPIWVVGNTLHVVMADPTREGVIERLRAMTGCQIQISLGLPSEIRRAIEETYGPASGGESHGQGPWESDLVSADEQVEVARDPSGALFLDTLLRRAWSSGARAVLFELAPGEARIRMRESGEWSVAARCRPAWLGTILDRLERHLDPLTESASIRMGRFEIRSSTDEPPLDVALRSWKAGGKRVVLALPAPRSNLAVGELASQLPDRIFSAEGIVVVDRGGGTGMLGLRCVAALAASRDASDFVASSGLLAPGSGLELPESAPLSDAWRTIRAISAGLILLGNATDEDPVATLADARLRGRRLATLLRAKSGPDAAARLRRSPFFPAAGELWLVEAAELPALCASCRRPTPAVEPIRLLAGVPGGVPLYAPGGCPSCGGSGFRGSLAVAAAAPLAEVEQAESGPLAPRMSEALAAGRIAAADWLEWRTRGAEPSKEV